MKPLPAAVAILLLLGAADRSMAQRADSSPVLEPPKRAVPIPPVDIAPAFAAAYRNAGAPKVVLLWNRALSDESQATTIDRRVTREVGVSSGNTTHRSTTGDEGAMSTTDEDSKFDRTRTETSGKVVSTPQARKMGLEERFASMLERAFVNDMNRAGLMFVDRSLAIRSTASRKYQGGGDPMLIEAEAIRSFADLMMEVLWIEDKDAPAGYAFDIRTKDLKSGREIASIYTRGVPWRAPSSGGGWVAGKDGYEFARPSAPKNPSPAEVGSAISQDVMRNLTPAFATVASSAWRR